MAHFLAQPIADQVIVQGPNKRWYISMGHAGFNSPANNGDGYLSARNALAAHRYYANQGSR